MRASQCLQCTGLLHAPPKSVQGDLGLADTHKQWQPVHCTPKLMYKKIDTQRNTKISETPRCPTMARHLVSGASCVPCVENQTLGKTRLHKRSGSNHCPMPKKILHQCTKPLLRNLLIKKKTKDIRENSQTGIAAKATQKNLLWTPRVQQPLKLMNKAAGRLQGT